MTARSIYIAAATRRLQPRRLTALRSLHCASRALLVLIGVICAVMPYSEYMWDWDGFARGGSDMELGVMCCVAVLCLAIVLLGHARHLVQGLLRSGAQASPSRREKTSAANGSSVGRGRSFVSGAAPLHAALRSPLRI